MSSTGSPSPAASPIRFLSARAQIQAVIDAADSGSEDDQSSASSTSSRPDEDDDDEAGLLRPRGRLAARMMAKVGKAPAATTTTSNGHHNSPDRTNKENNDDGSGGGENDEDKDDDEMPVAPRRPPPRRPGKSAQEDRTPRPDLPRPDLQQTSPGLFIAPSPAPPPARQGSQDAASDDEEGPPILSSGRFKALVEKKRQERLAREAAEAGSKKAQRPAARQPDPDPASDDGITDDEGGHALTQKTAARPARKAGKKALEEMNRETQRMARNMQLGHEAKTRKKISKSTLFERFNFRPGGGGGPTPPPTSSPCGEEQPARRQEEAQPVAAENRKDVDADAVPVPGVILEEDAVAAAAAAATATPEDTSGKDKTAKSAEVQEKTPPPKNRRVRVVMTQLETNMLTLGEDGDGGDNDDCLRIRPKTKLDAIFDRAPQQKTHESRSLHVLRQLAHVAAPGKESRKRDVRSTMSAAEWEATLSRRVREQAQRAISERIELLRAQGIEIQTEEERERARIEVENMVARARDEAEQIMQREREDARRERKAGTAGGEEDPLAWDDSSEDDGDYEEGVERALVPIELSGSEEEDEDGDGDEEEAEDEAEEGGGNGCLVDDAAEDGISGDDDDEDQEAGSDADMADAPVLIRKPRNANPLLSDDDDDQEDKETEVPATPAAATAATPAPKPFANSATTTPYANRVGTPCAIRTSQSATKATPLTTRVGTSSSAATPCTTRVGTPSSATRATPSIIGATPSHKTISPAMPTSVLRSATKSFIPGLPVRGPAGIGLTQMFAGTMMSDSQMDGDGDGDDAIITGPTPSVMPDFDTALTGPVVLPDDHDDHDQDMVLDSQPTPAIGESQLVRFSIRQSQAHGFDSLASDFPPTQATDLDGDYMLEPTQDGGLQDRTPMKQRFVDALASTADTVLVGGDDTESVQSSPLLIKKGKLRRKADVMMAVEAAADEFGSGTNRKSAFEEMRKAGQEKRRLRALAEIGRKKKSKARDMVEEQAEESDDEYAGLGGVDGENSEDEDDDAASVHEIIDDDARDDVDEAKLAAFYADRERADDEKQLEKLYRDVTTGMLRRKRGAGFDLDDDEDDGGAARRRMKQRKFAQMQKALFADERIKRMAEKPGSKAFLRTIEDRDSEDEDEAGSGSMSWLNAIEQRPDDSEGAEESQPQSRDGGGGGGADVTVIPNSQPPASRVNPRRKGGGAGRRPTTATTLGEIRESLSSLLEDPSGSVITATDLGSDEDDENESDAEREDGAPGRTESSNNNRRRTKSSGVVVDRIALRSRSSSGLSAGSSASRVAFAGPRSGAAGGFRVPPLLRRATTNSSTLAATASSSSSGVGGGGGENGGNWGVEAKAATSVPATTTGFTGEEGRIKKSTAGRRSGVSSFAAARESERRAAATQGERKREDRRVKGAERRSRAVVGGLFGTGRFE